MSLVFQLTSANEGGKLKGLPKDILRASHVLGAATNEQQEGGLENKLGTFCEE